MWLEWIQTWEQKASRLVIDCALCLETQEYGFYGIIGSALLHILYSVTSKRHSGSTVHVA